ncbi:MAG: nucleotidyl transferase AbiEii/AbiGii toxin family protein [Actinomycetota bacterium]
MMAGVGSYSSAAAFRQALEDQLKSEALRTGVPYDRLRKEAAFQRLLARVQRVSTPDSWALKGTLALIARIGTHVRATHDVDANWRRVQAELEEILDGVIDTDLGDGFEFEIGDATALEGEGPEGAFPYTVTARLAGRIFEKLKLDVNLTIEDPRPVEIVGIKRNPFAFIGEVPLKLPMISPAQQLAEKLHAYTRRYAAGISSRSRDLFDMLVIAQEVALPTSSEIAVAGCAAP